MSVESVARPRILYILLFLGLIAYWQEAYVSGMSEGGTGTKWYRLEVLGGIYVEPAAGSEDVIYGGLTEEGEDFARRLGPYREKFEQVVLEAKKKWSAPIVIYDQEMDGGYIDGVIVEDVPEFDPASLPANMDLGAREERLMYEEHRFRSILADESARTTHFMQCFKKGSHIHVEFTVAIPNDMRSYKLVLAVDGRIKRSTLNWIRDRITPDVRRALELTAQ